mmetsp:Transcript_4521/g.12725  ORF Transcript_4521/g.12725 Transcript_4521/m.12725 type:complete len:204 (+) Transcript_4521:1586-2197(+)
MATVCAVNALKASTSKQKSERCGASCKRARAKPHRAPVQQTDRLFEGTDWVRRGQSHTGNGASECGHHCHAIVAARTAASSLSDFVEPTITNPVTPTNSEGNVFSIGTGCGEPPNKTRRSPSRPQCSPMKTILLFIDFIDASTSGEPTHAHSAMKYPAKRRLPSLDFPAFQANRVRLNGSFTAHGTTWTRHEASSTACTIVPL